MAGSTIFRTPHPPPSLVATSEVPDHLQTPLGPCSTKHMSPTLVYPIPETVLLTWAWFQSPTPASRHFGIELLL